MILYEFEGKRLLSQSGILVPKSQLLTFASDQVKLSLPLVLKAQVLSGNRAKSGGILKVQTPEDLETSLKKLFGMELNQEKIEKVLIEEMIEVDQEYYLSLTYDTDKRTVILTISQEGGTGVEDRKVNAIGINLLNPITNLFQGQVFGLPQSLINKFIEIFLKEDCLLLEINPLVKTKNSEWIALDAKIKLDDDAKFRHEGWDFPPRSAPGHTLTSNEIEAKKIDQGDYRGTAGSAYFDLPGDIAILSSGGGVSLTALDTLLKFGGKPANYTEYSGNPPKEKVVKLTKIVLNKPNIHGLWIIGTVAANFTDIYETLSGIIEGLREVEKELDKKFDFPIVIRRGGPREEEAFAMLRQVHDFNLTLQGEETSITQSAQVMADLATKYQERND